MLNLYQVFEFFLLLFDLFCNEKGKNVMEITIWSHFPLHKRTFFWYFSSICVDQFIYNIVFILMYNIFWCQTYKFYCVDNFMYSFHLFFAIWKIVEVFTLDRTIFLLAKPIKEIRIGMYVLCCSGLCDAIQIQKSDCESIDTQLFWDISG